MPDRVTGRTRTVLFKQARRRALSGLLLAFTASTVLAAGTVDEAGAQAKEPNVVPQEHGAPLEEVRARRDALFERMMASPADLDVAFEYAMLSSKAGDLEAATSTLERMLIFAPEVPRLRLELGALYFRLGSYELARSNFSQVLEQDNVPFAVRARVERYMAEIDKRMTVNRFSGTVMFGTRYDSNANGGVSDRIVNLNGFGFVLNDAAMADDDLSSFVSGNFHYSRDLASQGDRFDVDLATYGGIYAEHDEINLALGEARFGPVFNLERFSLENTELGVYGILGGVALKGETYRVSGGVGVNLARQFDPRTRGEVRFEYQYQDYRNSARRQTAENQTGDHYRVGATLQHRLTDRLTLFGLMNVERHDARFGFESNWETRAALGASYRFDSPVESLDQPWVVSAVAGLAGRDYDEPDPFINVFEAQEDVEEFVRGTLTVPLRRDWAMQTAVGYRNVDSNYDIDTLDNVNVSIGVMKRF